MELLNQKKIDALSNEIGEDNVPILLEIFLSELASYLKVLGDTSFQDKLSYLKEISHALKSSAASFGADALCELAVSIDAKVKQGAALQQQVDVVAMIALLQRTQHAYTDWQVSLISNKNGS